MSGGNMSMGKYPDPGLSSVSTNCLQMHIQCCMELRCVFFVRMDVECSVYYGRVINVSLDGETASCVFVRRLRPQFE